MRITARARTLPPPATPDAVTAAEETIGLPLPPLLRHLYVEVAELYQGGQDPSGHIPAGLVPPYDWGCTNWSLDDFRDPAGPMWCNPQGEHWPQGVNLAEWLTGTLAETLTVRTLLESQPTA
ncbi:hypothetical protein ACIQI8_34590 [Streptomyces sp. NPDC092369]|uniref:hypothetical protein n=1 Tax=Streptomyces sp. NPDC092369 TaxID=3366015 RepID=UPI003807CB63